jgi:hypothetical protein
MLPRIEQGDFFMRSTILVTTFLTFAGCATTGGSTDAAPVAQTAPAQTADGQKPVKLICVNEKSTGSNFSERVCRRVDDNNDAQRNATQVQLLQPHAFHTPGG